LKYCTFTTISSFRSPARPYPFC